MNQELKEIYIDIAKGITNNYEDDIKYIASQIEVYHSHQRNTEIIRKLGILYYDLLPEDNKQDLVKVVQMNEDNVQLLFFIAQYLITQNEKSKALDILTIIVKELETWERSSDIQQYFSFDNLIELFLYAQSHETKKEIKRSKYPYHEFYRTIAAIQYAEKDLHNARSTQKKALLHNPVSADILLDCAEVYMSLSDYEQYLSYTKEALQYAYEIEALARCYRNIGNYYVNEGNYEVAIANYYMSLVFEKNDMALKALYRIYEITKEELTTPDLDVIKEVLDQAGIQVGASTLVVDTLLQLAKEYDEMSERSEAIHYLEMAYKLTNDDSLIPVIEEMKTTLQVD